LIVGRHVPLHDGPPRPDAPALAYVRMLAESVRGAEDVGAGPELGKSLRLAGSGRLRLQPVEKPQAHTLGVLEGHGLLPRRPVEDTLIAIVVARPVDHADVARVSDAGRKQAPVHQTAGGPEAALGMRRLLQHLVLEPARLLAVDLAAVHVDAEGIRLAVA